VLVDEDAVGHDVVLLQVEVVAVGQLARGLDLDAADLALHLARVLAVLEPLAELA
jgi:hypothetical protein